MIWMPVVLVNYATEHATYAIRCLDMGLHVLSECLPCETMAQAVELLCMRSVNTYMPAPRLR